MKSFSLAVLGFASLTLSAPESLDTRQPELQTTIENYVFNISIADFSRNRNAKIGPAELDWSSDGCSSAPDKPFGFDFQNSCYRHDFAYRNFKKQGQFTQANKGRIDSKFEQDLLDSCGGQKFKIECDASATIYYLGVKAFGKRHAAETLEAQMAAEWKMGE